MPTDVTSNAWGSLIYYDDWRTLELRWLPSTRDGGESDLRETMVLFAAESERLKPAFLLVDTTDFFHKWDEGMMEWRDQTIVPRYNAAGVSKFAFIVGSEFPGQTVESGAAPAPDGPADFPTGWFMSRDAAYNWLAG